MGRKRLLRTINITDETSTFYDGIGTKIISVVHDETEQQVEVYNVSFATIGSDSSGYVISEGETAFSSLNVKELDIGLTSPGYTYDHLHVGFKDNVIYGSSTSQSKIDIINLEGGDITTYSAITTDLTSPKQSILSTDQSKLYVLDDSDKYIYVFNVSDLTNITRVSSEDINLSATTTPTYFDIYNGKLYVADQTTTLRIYSLSTLSQVSTITLATAGHGVTLDPSADRIYVSDASATMNIYVYAISDESNKATEEFTIVQGKPTIFVESSYLYSAALETSPSLNNYVLAYDLTTPTSPTKIKTFITTGGGTTATLDDTVLRGVNDGLLFGYDPPNHKVYMACKFPSALTRPPKLNYTNPDIGIFWESKETEYGFQDGDNYLYFEPFPSIPYVLKKSIPLSDIQGVFGVFPTNVSGAVENYSEPTGKRTTDGSVTLLAKGGTSPYTYSIVGKDGKDERAQSGTTFSNLNPGNYTFRVRDANGIYYDLDKFTLKYNTTTFANYGLIYTHQFSDINGNLSHRIQIYDRDTATSNTNIDAGDMPASYTLEGQGEDIYDLTILPGSLNLGLIATTLEQYIDLARADDERYGVVWSIDDGGAYNERWRGYLLPESYSQEYGDPPVNVGVTFTDRLGDLKNIPFANRDVYNINEGYTGGEKSQLGILLFCFRQLNLDMDGLRIVCDWFEENHASTSTDTPFEQTYIDTDSYFTRDDESLAVDQSKTLEDVVKAILEPYSCMLVTWAGYYWIIKQKDYLDHNSFSYVEYDMTGTQVATGTQTNYVDFGTASGSNRWRWRGGQQNLTTTRVYRDVELTLMTEVIKRGLTPNFIGANLIKLGPYVGNNFRNFPLVIGNPCDYYFTDLERQRLIPNDIKEEEKLIWTFDLFNLGFSNGTATEASNSNTKMFNGGSLNYSGTDRLSLEITLETWLLQGDYVFGVKPNTWPYIRLKWQLLVGQYYYNQQEERWTTTATVNEYFLQEKYQEKVDIKYNIPMRETENRTDNYTLTVFAPSHMEYDLDSDTEANMITALKAVATAGVANGVRLVCRHDDTPGGAGPSATRYYYYFYELVQNQSTGSEPDVVEPTDYNASTNNVRWKLAALKYTENTNITHSGFYNIDLKFLPNGSETPNKFNISKASNPKNKVTLKKDLFHFDAPEGINNPELLYYNILKYDQEAGLFIDTVATKSWDDGGASRRIQQHRLDWLTRLCKQGRIRIGGAVDYNTEIIPFQALRVPNDDNRKFLINGGSWDLRNNQISGEFVEIGSDTVTEIKSIDNSADTSAGE